MGALKETYCHRGEISGKLYELKHFSMSCCDEFVYSTVETAGAKSTISKKIEIEDVEEIISQAKESLSDLQQHTKVFIELYNKIAFSINKDHKKAKSIEEIPDEYIKLMRVYDYKETIIPLICADRGDFGTSAQRAAEIYKVDKRYTQNVIGHRTGEIKPKDQRKSWSQALFGRG